MAYCSNCGTELNEGANFCHVCGAPVDDGYSKNDQSKRKQEYAGKLIKCPNCGELIDAFVSNCPSCGHEIRDAVNSDALHEFSMLLTRTNSDKEKVNVIRSFPIPNTKEDILEFMILASTNINENQNYDDEVSDAWIAKIKQAYQKAELSFKGEPEFVRVQNIYKKVMDTIYKNSKAQKSARTGTMLSDLTPYLPNLIIITCWLISLFALIPFCMMDKYLNMTNYSLTFFAFDLLVGIFLIPLAFKGYASLPKVVTILGLFLGFLLIILKHAGNPYEKEDHYAMLLFFMAAAAIIIFARMLLQRRNENRTKVQEEASIRISLITVLLCLAFCLITFGIANWGSSTVGVERYFWPETGLSQYLPVPSTKYGEIRKDTESEFYIDLDRVTRKQFEDYAEACKEYGFTDYISKTNSSFEAYNKDEFHLKISYYNSGSMNLHLDAPMSMSQIRWADNDLTSQIPKPDFSAGNIDTETSERFVVYLDGFTSEKFDEYVDNCIDRGFTIDYSRSDTEFKGYNEKGYYLDLKHELFDKLYIKIEKPEDNSQ